MPTQIESNDADIAAKSGLAQIQHQGRETLPSQFGQLDGLKVRAESDPEINKAVTYLPEALALVDRGKGQQNTASLRRGALT